MNSKSSDQPEERSTVDVVYRTEGVVEVWLDRPEKRNALNSAMRARLIDALGAVEGHGGRVVVVRARGPVFCAGLDLKERATTLGSGGPSPIEPVLEAIQTCPVPVVAVVQGDALAGGCELVLACDLVLATPDAGLGMPLVRLGMMPNARLIARLIDALGQDRARGMLMLGERIEADELERTRAVWRVVRAEDLEATVVELAGRLSGMPQLAMRTVKATINQLVDRSVLPGMADIEAMVLAVQRSADAQEGIRAHLDRRPPAFTGE